MTAYNMPDGCDPDDYEATIGEGPKAPCRGCGLSTRNCDCHADADMERLERLREREGQDG